MDSHPAGLPPLQLIKPEDLTYTKKLQDLGLNPDLQCRQVNKGYETRFSILDAEVRSLWVVLDFLHKAQESFTQIKETFDRLCDPFTWSRYAVEIEGSGKDFLDVVVYDADSLERAGGFYQSDLEVLAVIQEKNAVPTCSFYAASESCALDLEGRITLDLASIDIKLADSAQDILSALNQELFDSGSSLYARLLCLELPRADQMGVYSFSFQQDSSAQEGATVALIEDDQNGLLLKALGIGHESADEIFDLDKAGLELGLEQGTSLTAKALGEQEGLNVVASSAAALKSSASFDPKAPVDLENVHEASSAYEAFGALLLFLLKSEDVARTAAKELQGALGAVPKWTVFVDGTRSADLTQKLGLTKKYCALAIQSLQASAASFSQSKKIHTDFFLSRKEPLSPKPREQAVQWLRSFMDASQKMNHAQLLLSLTNAVVNSSDLKQQDSFKSFFDATSVSFSKFMQESKQCLEKWDVFFFPDPTPQGLEDSEIKPIELSAAPKDMQGVKDWVVQGLKLVKIRATEFKQEAYKTKVQMASWKLPPSSEREALSALSRVKACAAKEYALTPEVISSLQNAVQAAQVIEVSEPQDRGKLISAFMKIQDCRQVILHSAQINMALQNLILEKNFENQENFSAVFAGIVQQETCLSLFDKVLSKTEEVLLNQLPQSESVTKSDLQARVNDAFLDFQFLKQQYQDLGQATFRLKTAGLLSVRAAESSLGAKILVSSLPPLHQDPKTNANLFAKVKAANNAFHEVYRSLHASVTSSAEQKYNSARISLINTVFSSSGYGMDTDVSVAAQQMTFLMQGNSKIDEALKQNYFAVQLLSDPAFSDRPALQLSLEKAQKLREVLLELKENGQVCRYLLDKTFFLDQVENIHVSGFSSVYAVETNKELASLEEAGPHDLKTQVLTQKEGKASAERKFGPNQSCLSMNGKSVIRNTNNVKDALPGVSFNLKKITNAPVKVKINLDSSIPETLFLQIAQQRKVHKELLREADELAQTERSLGGYLDSSGRFLNQLELFLLVELPQITKKQIGFGEMQELLIFDQQVFNDNFSNAASLQKLKKCFQVRETEKKETSARSLKNILSQTEKFLNEKIFDQEQALSSLGKRGEELQAEVNKRRLDLSQKTRVLNTSAEKADMLTRLQEKLHRSSFQREENR